MGEQSQPDDRLARALTALRNASVPAGPSRRTTDRTIAALETHGIGPGPDHPEERGDASADGAGTPAAQQEADTARRGPRPIRFPRG